MSDLGTMVRKLRGDINRGPAHDARIRQAIEDAIRLYRATRFGWNLKRAQASLSPDDEYVALPDDWVQVDGLVIGDGRDQDPLSQVDWSWIDDHLRDRSRRGKPTKFAIETRQLRLYLPADRSYSLALAFLCDLPGISASASDGATNAWMTEGEELIRKRAMSDLLVTYIGGDAVMQGIALRSEVSLTVLPRLESQAAREQATGKIRPWL